MGDKVADGFMYVHQVIDCSYPDHEPLESFTNITVSHWRKVQAMIIISNVWDTFGEHYYRKTAGPYHKQNEFTMRTNATFKIFSWYKRVLKLLLQVIIHSAVLLHCILLYSRIIRDGNQTPCMIMKWKFKKLKSLDTATLRNTICPPPPKKNQY